MMMMIVIYCSFSETNRANLIYLPKGKLRRLGVQCMSMYAKACISKNISVRRASLSSTASDPYGLHATAPSYFRAWASRWQLVLGTLLPGHRPASHDLGSLCLLAGPLPPLRPCPLLLWAGFDTRLCSPSRICRPRFTRPRVGIGACCSLGAGAMSSLFPRSALPRVGLSM